MLWNEDILGFKVCLGVNSNTDTKMLGGYESVAKERGEGG
jgi:hypothetical protein